MALTPEQMQEIQAALAARMGGQAPNPTAPQLENIGEGEGGMGFGGITPAAKGPTEAFNPMDTNIGGAAGGVPTGGGESALGGLASGLSGAMSMAKALRSKGKEPFAGIKDLFKGGEQIPETTPLPD